MSNAFLTNIIIIFIALLITYYFFNLFFYQTENLYSSRDIEYENWILKSKFITYSLLNHINLLKLEQNNKKKEYKKIFFASLFFSLLFSILGLIFVNLFLGILLFILIYILTPYLYCYFLKERDVAYKKMVSNEVVELFITFNLLYPTYRNPDSTLRYITSIEKSEINRQMENMLMLISEKGLEKGVNEMIYSTKGIEGLNIFIELYMNLKREGAKALQNINSYISNVIKIKEMDAEKRINETKTKIELITAVIIFVGLAILILAPMFLGKFDGENSLIDYLGDF